MTWWTSCGWSSSPSCSAPATRLFDETTRGKPLRLVAQQRIGEGLVLLTYEFLVVDRGEQSAVTLG